MDASVEFKFDKDDKAESAHVKVTIEMSSEVSDAEFEALKETLTSGENYKNVSAKKDGKKVILEYDAEASQLGSLSKDLSYEGIKKSGEANDFTCK